ncbi:glycoside hydrolase [Desarmillaria tabescens]|uniref:alpha-1,2-Mannosidase n=1 Tax=Armillaria tabescens TaxID=1929756 RepID=A0AA39KCN7_ARMTA|nr:glycoside hydrolase [Desarmillaria tabescens]KAK0457421.1 glycoside hydrolase [Desarmillaria tabescens]
MPVSRKFIRFLPLACICGLLLLLGNWRSSQDRWSLNTYNEEAYLKPDAAAGKRAEIVEAFKHAWHAYERDAMGADEYHPLTHKGSNFSVDGGMGYTTCRLHRHDYARARRWVEQSLSFDKEGLFSTFETTIRVLGGLLSAFTLTQDKLYVLRAIELADRLLPAFDTNSGLPLPSVNLARRVGIPDSAAPEIISTAEAATLQLEFRYLAQLAQRPDFWRKSEKVMHVIHDLLDKAEGLTHLAPILMKHTKGLFVTSDIRLGSRGDSYYEYLLKQFLQTNRTEWLYREMYEKSVRSIHIRMEQRTYRQKMVFIAELHPGSLLNPKVIPKQDHLVCFFPGTLMLGAVTSGITRNRVTIPPKVEQMPINAQRDWYLGLELLETCMETHNTETGLAPEIVMFKMDEADAGKGHPERDWYIKGSKKGGPASYDARYMLRPDTAESLFIAWRLTHDSRYRKYAWDIFSAIQKHCRLKNGGYATVRDVDTVPVSLEDKQETFFLSETLKYLYLTFSDDSVLPLKGELIDIILTMGRLAHPLPVFKPNPGLMHAYA